MIHHLLSPQRLIVTLVITFVLLVSCDPIPNTVFYICNNTSDTIAYAICFDTSKPMMPSVSCYDRHSGIIDGDVIPPNDSSSYSCMVSFEQLFRNLNLREGHLYVYPLDTTCRYNVFPDSGSLKFVKVVEFDKETIIANNYKIIVQ